MGLITGLLTLPLAPVRGVAWIAEQLLDAAENAIYDPSAIRRQLTALHQDLEDGLISLAEFEEEEGKLLDRLEEAGRPPAAG